MSHDTPSSTAIAAEATHPGSNQQRSQQGDAFENLLHEGRRFPPAPEFAADAVVTAADYAEADADRPAFWARQA
ncbi:MAG TPA: acetyl-coenzyme A synthetase, partial [Arthrobacter sp.]